MMEAFALMGRTLWQDFPTASAYTAALKAEVDTE